MFPGKMTICVKAVFKWANMIERLAKLRVNVTGNQGLESKVRDYRTLIKALSFHLFANTMAHRKLDAKAVCPG